MPLVLQTTLLDFRNLILTMCMYFLQFISCLYIAQGLSLLIDDWCCRVWVICRFYSSFVCLLLGRWELSYTSQENTTCSNTTFHSRVHIIYTGLMKPVDKWGNQHNQFHVLNYYTRLFISLWNIYKHHSTYTTQQIQNFITLKYR
jgi:hypothetical protein